MKGEVDMRIVKRAKHVNFLSLFTSGSTLICCALPATLVSLGSVATLTSLISTFPQLIWISEHKVEIFSLAAFMLLLAGYMQWQARNAPCPAEPLQSELCSSARRRALYVYWVSVSVFTVGVIFAFIAPIFM